MTEAQTLDAVFRNLTKLGQSATKQMREEDGDDPLSNVTLAELREYAAGINSTIKKLEDEDTFFSGESELGQEPDNELGAMLAAAREGSRKLAIALSASKFGDSVHTTLRSIENFCRPELLHDLAVAKVSDLLELTSKPLERLEAARETNSIEKEQKATLAGEIQSNVDSKVIPGLKKHVLRVGVGKGLIDTAKLGDLLQQSEYPLIEQVHCELEHCRDLIVEEKTVRKMEKRILEQQDSASTRWVEVSHSN